MKKPYISFIAASRNDNHGGSLNRRMQIFIDALIEQCDRHQLDAELILVEWNPPAERKSLAEEMRWPKSKGHCDVRIVTVPPEIHARHRHAESLPLFQMIAKNVGIRRARGEYIVCTNIDIIFSDELMAFLAKRQLTPDKVYRSLRVDADENVPADQPVEEILRYCRENVIRVNLPKASYEITKGVSRISGVIQSDGISIETNDGEIYHQKGSRPAIFVDGGEVIHLALTADHVETAPRHLLLDIDPQLRRGQAPRELIFRDQLGNPLTSPIRITEYTTLVLPVPAGTKAIQLQDTSSAESEKQDASLCILRIAWINDPEINPVNWDCYFDRCKIEVVGTSERPISLGGGLRGVGRRFRNRIHLRLFPRLGKERLVFKLLDEAKKPAGMKPEIRLNGTPVSLTKLPLGYFTAILPVSETINQCEIQIPESDRTFILTDVLTSGNTLKEGLGFLRAYFSRRIFRKSYEILDRDVIYTPEIRPVSAGRFSVIDGRPTRLLGITSEYQVIKDIKDPRSLNLTLIPGVMSGGGFQKIELFINEKSVFSLEDPDHYRVRISLPKLRRGDKIKLVLTPREFSGTSIEDPVLEDYKGVGVLMDMRWCDDLPDSRSLEALKANQKPTWDALPDMSDGVFSRNPLDINEEDLPNLYCNACGDFTLAHANIWNNLKGYAELEIFSMHLDTLFMYTAHYAGFLEERLPDSMVHYHIEHGGGWTPEGHQKLYSGLAKRKIGWLGHNHDVMKLVLTMRRLRAPLYFNGNDWGINDENLVQTIVSTPMQD